MREGRLQGREEQAHPRYLEVYIDDFTGVALTDRVPIPEALQHTHIDPVHTRARGGRAGGAGNTRARARPADGDGARANWVARGADQGRCRRP
eukprot:5270080-Pleurochrysis_carterae.AAC.1